MKSSIIWEKIPMKKIISILIVFLLVVTIFPLGVFATESNTYSDSYNKHGIGLNSVPNARELGGYVTKDGRKIKCGKLLRTGDYSEVTGQDLEKLVTTYHPVKDIDFRSNRQIITDGLDPQIGEAEYCRYPYSSLANFLMTPDITDHVQDYIQTIAKLDHTGNLIHDVYRDNYGNVFITDDGIKMIRGFFDEVLDANGKTVLWHCKHGKDRTGNAAMLLMTVLGVDKKTIIDDYMLTNVFLEESRQDLYNKALKITGDEATSKDIALLRGVSRDWIDQSYKTIENYYGSVDNFLHSKIGLTDEDYRKIQNAYLENTSDSSLTGLPFLDVAKSSWYYEAVSAAFQSGRMVGMTRTQFAPEAYVTRAQFAVVLHAMAGSPDTSGMECPFVDVPKESWAYKYVAWAYTNGLTAGISKTKYSPNARITRQQMALMLYRNAGSPPVFGTWICFDDAGEIGQAYRSAVKWASDNGIMTGYEDNTFRPSAFVNRAQLAVISSSNSSK